MRYPPRAEEDTMGTTATERPGDADRSLLWRRVDVPGLEHFRLREDVNAPRLVGTVLLAHEGRPIHVEYEIVCSRAWETRAVRVTCTHGPEVRRLELMAEGGRWRRGGSDVGAVADCLDVDLAVTPSTNTLPIRRLDLAIGAGRDVTAAWIQFPELAIEPLPQRYTRIAARRFRYESRGGAFTAELDVDERGVVVRYAQLWARVALAPWR